MADPPEAPARRKKFDVRHPGPKEYAIVVGGTLAAYLLVSFLKNRKANSAAAAQTGADEADDQGATTGGSSGPAGGAAAFWLWLQDHAGTTSTSTTTTTTDTGKTQSTGGGTTSARVKLTKAEAALLREAGLGAEIAKDGTLSRKDYTTAFTDTGHTARPWLLQRLKAKGKPIPHNAAA
jgi:hypothetical protein